MAVQDLRINQVGIIISGPSEGWYVKVEDDSLNTGGYLVLLFHSLDPNDHVGFDDWVETNTELQAYFERSGWTIKWLEPSQTPG